VLEGQELHLWVLHAKHDHMLAGHFGQSKTFSLVCRKYSWLKLQEFVVNYVKSCSVCARNKSRQHWLYGYLNQLSIPLQPWDSILMDFIEQLPPLDGFTDILCQSSQL